MSVVICRTHDFPARIADLAFSLKVPEHWTQPELPPVGDDWSDPSLLAPLMMAVSPTSPTILLVSARPAFDNGTILDWVPWLLETQQMKPLALGEENVNGLRVCVGMARQADSDLGPRHYHFAFFEDGGRRVSILLTCPESIAGELHSLWREVLASFRLARPRGQTRHDPPTVDEPPGVSEPASPSMPAPSTEAPTVSHQKTDDRPAWWTQARQLEVDDRLEAAEELIRQSIPYQSFALEIADLYRQRYARLRDAGRQDLAAMAYQKAIDWAHFYASGATSGGEGLAMSAERDAFLNSLART